MDRTMGRRRPFSFCRLGRDLVGFMEEAQILQQQMKVLQSQLDAMRKRLQELTKWDEGYVWLPTWSPWIRDWFWGRRRWLPWLPRWWWTGIYRPITSFTTIPEEQETSLLEYHAKMLEQASSQIKKRWRAFNGKGLSFIGFLPSISWRCSMASWTFLFEINDFI